MCLLPYLVTFPLISHSIIFLPRYHFRFSFISPFTICFSFSLWLLKLSSLFLPFSTSYSLPLFKTFSPSLLSCLLSPPPLQRFPLYLSFSAFSSICSPLTLTYLYLHFFQFLFSTSLYLTTPLTLTSLYLHFFQFLFSTSYLQFASHSLPLSFSLFIFSPVFSYSSPIFNPSTLLSISPSSFLPHAISLNLFHSLIFYSFHDFPPLPFL